MGAPISFSCPRAGVCCCSYVTNAVSSSPLLHVALAEGKGHLGGELFFIWEGAHNLPLGSLRVHSWSLHIWGTLGLWPCWDPAWGWFLGLCPAGAGSGGGVGCCLLLTALLPAVCPAGRALPGGWGRVPAVPQVQRPPAARPPQPQVSAWQPEEQEVHLQPGTGRGSPEPCSCPRGPPQALLLALTTSPLCSAVQSLPEPADGDAGQHHAALRPLHQTQR